MLCARVDMLSYLFTLVVMAATAFSDSVPLLDNGIVPDVIDVAPVKKLNVEFPSGVVANYGNELTPTQVKDQPEVSWIFENPNSLYTLLMIDPDAPTRAAPSYSEVFHWGVVNIPGINITAGQTVAEFLSSGPGEGSGLHRYILLVFKQSFSIITDKFIPSNSRQGRTHFSTRNFAKKYSLGAPVAGNFYLAAYDDYVPVRNSAITDWATED